MKIWYLLVGLLVVTLLLPKSDEKSKTQATVTTSPVTTETQATVATSPVATEAASLSTAPQETIGTDQVFLSAIELSVSSQAKDWARTIPDSSKIRVGKESCQAFDQGVTFEQVTLLTVEQIGNNPAAIEYVGALVGAGSASYCLQHKGQLP